MKLLVVGGSGLIGSHMMRVAIRQGHSAAGTYRNYSTAGLRRLDCADEKAFTILLEDTKPDAVVNAAGWSWVDGCEDNPERAMAENAHQPARMAELCRVRGIRFAYFSSSYVFDGRSGSYAELDSPAPINMYGRSKLEGERLILQANSQALILRVICVYGVELQRKNFAYQVLKAMREGKPLMLPSDQEGNPTYAGDIARWVLALLETKSSGGVWHLAGRNPECNRVEWARQMVGFFEASGVSALTGFAIQSKPTAELNQRALRPLKAGLVCGKAMTLGIEPTEFQSTLSELL